MYDELLGYTNYYLTPYFWVTSAFILAAIYVIFKKARRRDNRRGGYRI